MCGNYHWDWYTFRIGASFYEAAKESINQGYGSTFGKRRKVVIYCLNSTKSSSKSQAMHAFACHLVSFSKLKKPMDFI